VVLLDDCQWADELTLRLIRHWRQHPPAPGKGRHSLLVVAFRSEEAGPGHLLRLLQPDLHLTLSRFDLEAIDQLAESMAGPLPAEALEVIERLSEGNPFLAVAVLQGLVESSALSPVESGGWVADLLALADVQSSAHAAAFLVRRVERLPPQVLGLLSAGAILGKEFEPEDACVLAGVPPEQAHEAVLEARRRQLIWGGAAGAPCAFVHDKLRQTFLQRLSASERQELHRRAALALEARALHRVFDLAYHFDSAGDSARALPHALAAAEQARAQHSLDLAEQMYRTAQRGVTGSDQAQYPGLRVARGLGEVLMLRGRYAEAAAQLELALALAEGLDRAQVEGKLGELAFKRDDIATAGYRFERALGLLGRRAPRLRISFLVLVVWEAFVQLLHSALPRWFPGRRAPTATDLLAVRLYSRLAHLYWFYRGTVPALWSHLRGLNLAERYLPTPELAQAYSEHAPGMSLLGWFSRGIAYAEKSLDIRKALGDLWGQGQSLHFHGVVLYACARYREAIDRCREAIRLLGRTGDQWEVNIARFQVGASLYRLGRLREAVEEAQRMYQSGLDLGDAQASGISLDVRSRASLGRVPSEIIQAELARKSEDVQRAAQVWLAEAVRLLSGGEAGDAAGVLQQAADRLNSAGVMNAWVAPVLPWLATALREQAERLTDRVPNRRRALLARAWRAARRAARLSGRFPNEQPHALRELGLLSALRGDARRALRYLDEAVAVARALNARYELALTRRARAELGVELGRPEAAGELIESRLELQQLEAGLEEATAGTRSQARPVTLSLVDRFDALLESGRQISSALSRDEVFAAALNAALRLLRAEVCVVLASNGQWRVAASASALHSSVATHGFSQELVQQAVRAGRAIADLAASGQDTSESLLLSGARSALCVPIHVRGRAAYCLYVTHRQVAGLFGEEERRLADLIASLTGVALENADGVADLRALNQTLEQRIAELRRAQERIQEQAALLDKAQDAIAVLDLCDRVLFWNKSAERLYGWKAAEALGRTMQGLLYGEPSSAHQQALAAVLRAGEWAGELRHRTRTHEVVTVESRWTRVLDDQGLTRCLLVVSTDVTEKRRLEAQFLRAQRIESIGKLTAGVAHDFNNVLTPILLSAQLLRNDYGTTQEREAILAGIEDLALRGPTWSSRSWPTRGVWRASATPSAWRTSSQKCSAS
jgi:two-component system sensor kinase